MQKYDAIENGIAQKDVKALREAIGSICYTCRDFSDGEFVAAIDYVENKNGIKIKDDSLVGNPTISSQKSDFTDEDFAKAIFELKKNFCDERISDVMTIGKKLYGKKKVENTPTATRKSEETRERTNRTVNVGTLPNQASHQQKNQTSNAPMIIGLVAVIVIILIIILLVNK